MYIDLIKFNIYIYKLITHVCTSYLKKAQFLPLHLPSICQPSAQAA